MAAVKFFKVTELPAAPEANSFYFVQNGDFAEHYVTGTDGTAYGVGNSEFINSLIEDALGDLPAAVNEVKIVADITARNDLATEDYNFLVLVLDASDDATVDSGAALYAFQNSNDTWHKVAEYESLDLVVNWGDIVDAPASTGSAIDAAVANSHSHANKAVLDELDDDDGVLTYNGEPIVQWDANEW